MRSSSQCAWLVPPRTVRGGRSMPGTAPDNGAHRYGRAWPRLAERDTDGRRSLDTSIMYWKSHGPAWLLLNGNGFQPGTDGPERFLAEEVGHLRHVHPAITHGAVDHPFLVPFIAVVAGLQVAQVRIDAPGDAVEAVAGGTVLVIGGSADGHGGLVLRMTFTVRVGLQPLPSELVEALGVDGLRRYVAMRPDLAGYQHQADGGQFQCFLVLCHPAYLAAV